MLGVYTLSGNILFFDRLVYVKTTGTEFFGLASLPRDPNIDYNDWMVRYEIDSCRWNIRAFFKY